jgi:thiamine-monophosphate kinase
MKEFELIKLLTRELPSNPATVVGPGDDCAVIDLGIPGKYALFKTDAVVEGVHYLADTAPERVGHKSLARCLSDIAAMAGTPVCALVTLALPKDYAADWAWRVYQGMAALARRYQVSVAGGETTTNPERTLLSISVLGTVASDRCILRSGAKPGDALFVTGELGGSGEGHHLDFEPRLAEAQWLAERLAIHAMIDLSDGLASDLRHILDASGCGAELLATAVPISPAAKRAGAANRSTAKPALAAALTDGEDFELLFAVASKDAVPLMDQWKERFAGTRLSCIGRLTETRGLRIKHRDRVEEYPDRGYEHFA